MPNVRDIPVVGRSSLASCFSFPARQNRGIGFPPPAHPRPMLAKIHTFSLLGIDALPVEVEADISPGALPKTTLVGLPEAAVKESLHRVERAIVNSGFLRPQDR